ncbi:hypothetical protein COV18_02280 [Candidatus Woesearchaeota archaeon CG10_big_fil_rev_8_21_14_0_10_37_12]|nr:MAG: hypothetical protein COV18_02280 [Candidatus Woesearchaeota archaeon CG10_big_fil_rev_8_21_14_0_10_37_12]
MDLINLSVFIGACLLLIIAGSLVVRSLVRLAEFLKVNEFLFSFIIAGLATSLPELFIGINAALIAQPAIALGTIIGSNIADITLVVGIATLLGQGLKVKSKIVVRDAYLMFFIVSLVVILMFVGKELSRLDGIILLVVLFVYLYFMIKKKEAYTATVSEPIKRWRVIGYVMLFLLALPVLFFSASIVVVSGTQLALDALLPPIFVGLFFIAIGTSLPELVVQIRAVFSGHPSIALGNIIGSVIWNSTLILGVVAIISPITGNLFLFLTSSLFMVIVCLLFAVLVDHGRRLTWKEGLVLLLMYVLFIIVELSLKSYYLVNGLV